MERGGGEVGRLAAVQRRSLALGGPDRGGVDRVRDGPHDAGPGVLLDDITLPDGTSTSFEDDDLGGWHVSGAPPGSRPNANDWIPATAASYPVGASVTTPDSIILGFGLEGLASPEERVAVMGRAIGYLLAVGG